MFWIDKKKFGYFSTGRNHYEIIAKDQTRWRKCFSYDG